MLRQFQNYSGLSLIKYMFYWLISISGKVAKLEKVKTKRIRWKYFLVESWEKYLLKTFYWKIIEFYMKAYVWDLSKIASNYLLPTVVYPIVVVTYVHDNHQTKEIVTNVFLFYLKCCVCYQDSFFCNFPLVQRFNNLRGS